MAKIKQIGTPREAVHKRTQQGGKVPKTSSMNKSFRAGYKKYRGQGR
tara:strand:+ start:81 stop:221 length:141 start_codon:yes stop_codon:yes gene_type:complete